MKRLLFFIFLLLLLILFLAFPDVAIVGVEKGISVCGKKIAPPLFIFLTLSGILLKNDYFFIIMKPFSAALERLFSIPKDACTPFILGLVCGFPVGAKAALSMYESGMINRSLYNRLLLFINNVSPAFVISSVGIGVFSDKRIGYFLLLCQVFSALFLAFISRFAYKTETKSAAAAKTEGVSLYSQITQSVSDAARGTITVSSFVIVFSFITHLLTLLPIKSTALLSLLYGITEMSCGVFSFTSLSPLSLSCVSFILGFGGFCIHMQAMALLEKSGFDFPRYLLFKLLNGLLSSLFCAVFCKLVL